MNAMTFEQARVYVLQNVVPFIDNFDELPKEEQERIISKNAANIMVESNQIYNETANLLNNIIKNTNNKNKQA